jgi:uncharacterized protein
MAGNGKWFMLPFEWKKYMIEDDYQVAKKIAEENLIKIENQLPQSLSTREDQIYNTMRLSGKSYIKQLEALYRLMDDLYSFFSQYTPCKKGCSHCCYITVSVSSLEAEFIKQRTGIKRVVDFVKRDFFGTPCPFLNNNICSISKYRPFVCRRHNALFDNPRWCDLDLCNSFMFPQVRFSEIDKSYQLILAKSGASLIDIRQAFQSHF